MQDSLSLALWMLGGWLLLSLLLITPLIVSSCFHRWRPEAPTKKRVTAWSLPDGTATQQTQRLAPQPGAPIASPVRQQQDRCAVRVRHFRPLGMEVSALSDGGRVPGAQENEDGFLAVTGARGRSGQLRPFGLFAVADGVGGSATGHEASRLTLLTLSQRFVPALTQSAASDEDLTLLLATAIKSANSELYQYNQEHLRPLGCTVTAALITDQQVAICHVGKNRAYLLGEEMPIRRVTVDHSIVESLVVAGFIQRDDIYTHPRRNRIYRCLGQGPQVEVDTIRLPTTPGARLLFCSDGLWEVLRDARLEEVLRRYPDATQASSQLVALAKERGGVDDITAILVKLTDAPGHIKRPGISHVVSNHMNLAL